MKRMPVKPKKKHQPSWLANGVDLTVLLLIFLYFIPDLLHRGGDRYEIVRLQFFIINIVNVVVATYLLWRATHFKISIRHLLHRNYTAYAYILFLVLCGASYFVAFNKSLAIVYYFQLLVVAAMVINLCVLLYNRLHLIYAIGFIAGFAGIFQAFAILIHLTSFTDTEQIIRFLSSSVLEGNAGNMNIMSSGLLLKVPLVFLALTHYTGIRRLFLAISLFSMFLCIFLINARTAIITIPFLFLLYFAFFHQIRHLIHSHILKLAYIFIPIIFAFIMANVVLSNSGREGRFESTTARVGQISLSEGSTQARFWFWQNGLDMARDNPILGVGIGNWITEQIPYGKSRYVLSMNAHNDFVEVMAETGIVNGIIYALLFVSLLWVNARRVLWYTDKRQQIIAFLALMMLAVYGIDAVINFPLQRPTMQIGFALLMVFTFLNKPISPSRNNRLIYIFILAFTLVPIYVTYHADQTAKLDRIVVMDNVDRNPQGNFTGDQLAAWHPRYPNISRQTTVSYDEYTGIYYYREKRYDEAIQYLEKGKKIQPYLGRPDFFKSLIYRDQGMTDSAYHYMRLSFEQVPFYSGIYREVVMIAGNRRDTSAIFSFHNTHQQAWRQPATESLLSTIEALRIARYPHEKILGFTKEIRPLYGEDKQADQALNNLQITQYLVEGQAYYSQGMLPQTLESYYKALAIDSTNVYALQNIGFHHYNLGNYKEAIPFLLKALEKPGLTGGNTEYIVGVSYININDKEWGCPFLLIAQEKNYSRAANFYLNNCN